MVYTLERYISILYTLASLSSGNTPINFIFMHVCKLETNHLITHVGGVINTKLVFVVLIQILTSGHNVE